MKEEITLPTEQLLYSHQQQLECIMRRFWTDWLIELRLN